MESIRTPIYGKAVYTSAATIHADREMEAGAILEENEDAERNRCFMM